MTILLIYYVNLNCLYRYKQKQQSIIVFIVTSLPLPYFSYHRQVKEAKINEADI